MIKEINNGHRFRLKLLTTQVTMNKQFIAGGKLFYTCSLCKIYCNLLHIIVVAIELLQSQLQENGINCRRMHDHPNRLKYSNQGLKPTYS